MLLSGLLDAAHQQILDTDQPLLRDRAPGTHLAFAVRILAHNTLPEIVDGQWDGTSLDLDEVQQFNYRNPLRACGHMLAAIDGHDGSYATATIVDGATDRLRDALPARRDFQDALAYATGAQVSWTVGGETGSDGQRRVAIEGAQAAASLLLALAARLVARAQPAS